ncbi:MAG: hypothetical protein KF782_12670 [Labilithrix sp.]|nr:hypothetical protein [Labilithrix sp.]
MAERKWGALASGATFESLATTIVFFDDPKASLFGRRGKDGGQDARSGDGTRVFQAKHHESGSAATAISDAKKEAAKIEKYRQPGHARHDQWKGVIHWRLVTNAAFNPTDKLTWDTEVVPLFAKQGLTADHWERENLNALLDTHPEIHRSFFENEMRVFLSLPEVKERLPIDEPFLRRDKLGSFCGRQNEKAKFRKFLASDNFFLLAHGAGGTGKTRLLVEAGDEIASEGAWQVRNESQIRDSASEVGASRRERCERVRKRRYSGTVDQRGAVLRERHEGAPRSRGAPSIAASRAKLPRLKRTP